MPRLPEHHDPGPNRAASAPYNFVPLPEAVFITPRETLPKHDRYDDKRHTGWLECGLKTCSPTYVRGMVSLDDFDKADRRDDEKLTEEEKVERKMARSPFYATDPEQLVEGKPSPTLPGSSLRGMLRTMVEILSNSKVKWVTPVPITFRAVAAETQDPLSQPYRRLIGNAASNIFTGYLRKKGSDWEIQPALRPQGGGAFMRVKDSSISADEVTGFQHFGSQDYKPNYFSVSFEVETRQRRNGTSEVVVTAIGDEGTGYTRRGTLVCSGNMLETGGEGQQSLRRNHALILPPDTKASSLSIRTQTVTEYRNSLTSFQEELWGGKDGCLKDRAPVFYVADRNNEVVWFGHTPNLRIPSQILDSHVATPADFVPNDIRGNAQPDMAEAIFGWVQEKGGMDTERAGRVFVTDAKFRGHDKDKGVWYTKDPLTPSILSGPKPTTFQHYLVQDKSKGHDPNDRSTLAHYGSRPDTTEIRGHKLYWHKGVSPSIEATDEEKRHESQLTRIVPLNSGVSFCFRVYFENLSDMELGALLTALKLPTGKRHHLGMGKPLGMGSVHIDATLHLTDRKQRYTHLLTGGGAMETGEMPAAQRDEREQNAEEAFRKAVVKHHNRSGTPQLRENTFVWDIPRFRDLAALLEWDSPPPLERTRYLPLGDERFRQRYVLPTPRSVLTGTPAAETLGTTPMQSGDPVKVVLVPTRRGDSWRARVADGDLTGSITSGSPPSGVDPKEGLEVELIIATVNEERRSITFRWPDPDRPTPGGRPPRPSGARRPRR